MKTPMLPYFKLTINDDDETGVYTNAFVDEPAHQKYMHAFGAQKKKRYFQDDEKRMVVGVMMSADTPIYRQADDDHPEHYVIFDAATISKIRLKFHRNNFGNEVNQMHNAELKIEEGVFMVDSYSIEVNNGPSAPEVFKDQNLKPGTWISSYRIDNDEIWNKVKNGTFKGFSVEGYFESTQIEVKKKFKAARGSFGTIQEVTKWDVHVDQDSFEVGTELTTSYTAEDGEVFVNKIPDGEYMLEDGQSILVDSDGVIRQIFNKNSKMKNAKSSKSWYQNLFGGEHKFVELTAADNTVLSYEGELAEGTEIFVMADGDQTPAPEGTYQVELNGEDSIITVDSNGLVTAIEVVPQDVEMSKELKEFMVEFKANQDAQIEELTDIIAQQGIKINAMESALASKFNIQPLKVEDTKQTAHWSEYLKHKNN